uniref:Uncharacterized protein n=1 Tax=Ignisphaera aggregans TaxID=334771 RepID=A0A7J2U2H0_9CREN
MRKEKFFAIHALWTSSIARLATILVNTASAYIPILHILVILLPQLPVTQLLEIPLVHIDRETHAKSLQP